MWSPAVATGRNRWQIGRPGERLNQAETDGKEELPSWSSMRVQRVDGLRGNAEGSSRQGALGSTSCWSTHRGATHGCDAPIAESAAVCHAGSADASVCAERTYPRRGGPWNRSSPGGRASRRSQSPRPGQSWRKTQSRWRLLRMTDGLARPEAHGCRGPGAVVAVDHRDARADEARDSERRRGA